VEDDEEEDDDDDDDEDGDSAGGGDQGAAAARDAEAGDGVGGDQDTSSVVSGSTRSGTRGDVGDGSARREAPGDRLGAATGEPGSLVDITGMMAGTGDPLAATGAGVTGGGIDGDGAGRCGLCPQATAHTARLLLHAMSRRGDRGIEAAAHGR